MNFLFGVLLVLAISLFLLFLFECSVAGVDKNIVPIDHLLDVGLSWEEHP